MKLEVLNPKINISVSALLLLMLVSVFAFAENGLNQIIVSGQVTNYEYGNPVNGHPVYIESELSFEGRKSYTNTVFTDINGYYYDTISTSENKGSFFVYTFDHYGETIDTTIHFRFHERDNSMVLADFKIYFPFQSEKLQAIFKYIQKVNGENNVFNFFDLTNHQNAISWKWNFGDGTTSTLQNPIHEFTSYGLFRVTLIVGAIIDGVIVESEISKQIYITQVEYYHLGGHVFSNHFPIDKGYAYLYAIDSSNHYHAFDTVTFDTLGYFYFYQVPEGNYIVKAEPMKESEYYGVLLPTYYGNSRLWEDAHTINLGNTSWEHDIKLEKGSGLFGGTGAISGNIKYINNGRLLGDYSAKGVNIYLLDDESNILTCHYSNDAGDFWFELIELNTYWLHPEITGITSDLIKVELTHSTPVVDDIEINILTSSISYVFPDEDDTNSELVGLPYPNPVSGTFSIPTISLSGKDVRYEVYDSFGHLISLKDISSTSDGFSIDASNMTPGVYTIRTVIEGENYDRRIVVLP